MNEFGFGSKTPPKMAPPVPSKTKLSVVVGWLMHVAVARGVQVNADADHVERVGLTQIVQHVVVRSVGKGASALLEVVARVILFLLALLLSWSPTTRAIAMHRVASKLLRRADDLQTCVGGLVAGASEDV